MTILLTTLSFMVALGVLVLVHEWGHYIVAVKSGVKVEKFSIGFGPKIIGFMRGETEFKISLLPLGGYVKLYGEDPMADADGDEEKAKEIAASPDAFSNSPVGARLATVMAGPVMNLILAIVLLPLVFMLGRSIPAVFEEPPVIIDVHQDSPAAKAGLLEGDKILTIDNQPVASWSEVMDWVLLHPNSKGTFVVSRGDEKKEFELNTIKSPYNSQEIGYTGFEPNFFWDNEPVVGEISPGFPAEKAGLLKGDRIVAINGKNIRYWTDLTNTIRESKGEPLTLKVDRAGVESLEVKLTPVINEGSESYVIGVVRSVNPDRFVVKSYSFTQAISKGWEEFQKLMGMTLDVLKRLFSAQLSYKALGGPIEIARAAGSAAETGLGDFIYFVAFLSMQLGILNLLPIPVLDGGHVLFMGIEAVIRRQISPAVKSIAMQVGFVLLIGLMILITFNDIKRLFGF